MPQRSRHKTKWPLARHLGLLGIVAIIIGFLGFLPLHAIGETKEGAAKPDACAECHEDVVKGFNGSLHNGVNVDCTACHGDATKHLASGEAGTIFAFKSTDTALQKSKQCLSCHKNTTSQYMASPHAKADMDCTQCHGIHKEGHSKPMMKSKLCMGCHEDIAAQFKLNERHRLGEGILECTSCHDVHGPAVRARLGGFKQETCLKCHTDKGGPFIFEHEGGKIEGCTVCHEVHGSPNRHLLQHQNVAELCFSCHTFAPSWHSRFTTGEANCVSCHSTIHGSNLSNIFLK